MSFLSPLALIGLVLVSLPVLIHLLARRRARRLDFPTLRYLRETPDFRLRPRSIHQPLLLALRVLALVLLIMGVARPLIHQRAQSFPVRLILIDASLSMSAPGRTIAAKEMARSLINKLTQDERAAIIACSSEATTLAAITTNRQQLLAAVENYQSGSGTIDFSKSFAMAALLLAREPWGAAEIDLISDFQQSNLVAPAARPSQLSARLSLHAVGAPVKRNAFLRDEAVRRTESGLELSVTESVADEEEGQGGARRLWAINAGASNRPDINWRTESNGQLTGSINALAPDDFDADDRRFFAFAPPVRSARVLLVESDAETSAYTGAALAAALSSLNEKNALLTRQRQLPSSAAELSSYALIALTLRGTPRASELQLLAHYAEAGGTLWLSLARDLDVGALNSLATTSDGRALPFERLARLRGDESLMLGAADLAAPPLRSLTENAFAALRTVKVHEGYAFEPRAGADTLMRWSDNAAAFVSARVGAGRILLLGTSTESGASELGRSAAFPSLAFSLLREAIAPRESLSYEVGEPINLRLPPETSVKVTDQAGRTVTSMARNLMQRPLSVFRGAGVYRLEAAGGVRFIALNAPGAESERALVAPTEAQRYFAGAEPLTQASAAGLREELERGGNTWRYFLGAAFALLVAELLVRARRRAMAEVNSTL